MKITRTTPAPAPRATDPLAPILAHFAPPRRATITCGPGWHPLLLTLHRELLDIDPDYQINCVGSVLGDPVYSIVCYKVEHESCCIKAFGPRAWPSAASPEVELNRLEAHLSSPEHKLQRATSGVAERNATNEEIRSRQQSLLHHYTALMEATCDQCGAPSSKEINALALELRCPTHRRRAQS